MSCGAFPFYHQLHSYTEISMSNLQNVVGERLIKDGVMVEWMRHGEGGNGDYHADDLDNVKLLHFEVSRITDKGVEEVSDSSYCSQVPATTDKAELQRLLEILMDQVYDPVKAGKSIKQICEELSWIEPGYGQGV
jgi:hypothetical protein